MKSIRWKPSKIEPQGVLLTELGRGLCGETEGYFVTLDTANPAASIAAMS